jgi:hypothetical protein
MRLVAAGVCAALAMILLAGTNQAGDKDKKDDKDEKGKPKYSIKEVMKKAHSKDGLLNKVASGKGEKADAEKLLEMYTALAKNKPPEGDAQSWKRFTMGLIAAAKVAVEGGPDSGKRLKAAANCTGCHKLHKG